MHEPPAPPGGRHTQRYYGRRRRASRALLGFELLLAMKHHARRLFTTGFQNSSAVVSITVAEFVMVARPPL
ncbi:hypothetical protein EVAR_91559_1 [Eumeta japonica]|uniref:Uncharacterized protein n=1 Tax=Eumeta variegata TaxID=151549 RepID=A0A4C1X8Y3_EUMVA|nr:hypothetical protein EVAR_91559_1 [Eumeta japonica]